jgi:exonuclease SbcD
MKLIHLSDLHLGKRVNEFSMLEDQKYIIKKIIEVIDTENPDGILIAGDVYDKTIPSVEAVELLDDFLNCMAKRKVPVFLISGNHDSPERLQFASKLIGMSGIKIVGTYDGTEKKEVLYDDYGQVNIFMLPFVKPGNVRRYFPQAEITTYNDGVRVAVENMNVDKTQRNILITHQFVTGAKKSESEEISVGGTDNVDENIFEDFDYVALGHIHGPQHLRKETVRYCGTPLKYSFSEKNHEKSVTILEMGDKEDIVIRTTPLIPIRDMEEICGTYNELVSKSFYESLKRDNYFRIILKDEEDVPGAMAKLRTIYPNIMRLEYDNKRTQGTGDIPQAGEVEEKTPFELIDEFYEKENNHEMSKEQQDYILKVIEKVWGEQI